MSFTGLFGFRQRQGTSETPFWLHHEGRSYPVVCLGDRTRPYEIIPTQETSTADIVVTPEGPFDVDEGRVTTFRRIHWAGGSCIVWHRAYTSVRSGNQPPDPIPARADNQHLASLLQHLMRYYSHPRWNLILGSQADRNSYTLAMLQTEARRQIEQLQATGVLLQDFCKWCGLPTNDTCVGFLSAGITSQRTLVHPFYHHGCGEHLCDDCHAVFETCYRCSFWAGLPAPERRQLSLAHSPSPGEDTRRSR